MSFLKNSSIRTKILSVLLPLCLVGASAAGYLSTRYAEAVAIYSNFVGHDSFATLELARANRNLNALSYGAYQIMTYDSGEPLFNGIRERYEQSKADVLARLNSVKALVPNQTNVIDSFIRQAEAIIQSTDKAVALGTENKNAEAKVELASADALILPASVEFTKFNDDRLIEIQKQSASLVSQTSSTITTSLIVITAVFSAGVLAALLVVSRGITFPIARLRERMVLISTEN